MAGLATVPVVQVLPPEQAAVSVVRVVQLTGAGAPRSPASFPEPWHPAPIREPRGSRGVNRAFRAVPVQFPVESAGVSVRLPSGRDAAPADSVVRSVTWLTIGPVLASRRVVKIPELADLSCLQVPPASPRQNLPGRNSPGKTAEAGTRCREQVGSLGAGESARSLSSSALWLESCPSWKGAPEFPVSAIGEPPYPRDDSRPELRAFRAPPE